MEKLTVQEKTWISRLESKNPSVIITTIREIRNHGNIRMLPYLFNLMKPSTHEIIRKSIIMLIGEIKVQKAVSYIVSGLENTHPGNDFTSLVAACWQSGLDFSEYIPVFIKIFMENDYQTSVEAFSVIEESIMNAGPEMQSKCIKILDNLATRISKEKHPLFRELVKVVSGRDH
ncbi:MAG: hypothetical protein JW973_05795 [Bacteroidales bacterium]|nr:hypothetical protein [Bacteroidales bacterium]